MPAFRRDRLPAEVRSNLHLQGDRVLASAHAVGDTWVIATRAALLQVPAAVDAGALPSVLCHPWTDVDHADLDGESQVLTVTWVDGSPPSELGIGAEAERFAVVLRERVQSSVVHTEHVTLPGGGTVRVVLRRADDGALASQLIGDARVRLSDPAVAQAVDEAESRVRAAAGLRT